MYDSISEFLKDVKLERTITATFDGEYIVRPFIPRTDADFTISGDVIKEGGNLYYNTKYKGKEGLVNANALNSVVYLIYKNKGTNYVTVDGIAYSNALDAQLVIDKL